MEGVTKWRKRHEFKLAHGFRKFFETQTQKVMNHNNIKILMGHSTSMGLSKNYYKPTEKEVLEDYLKAIDLLTIEQENILKKKVNELSQKSKDDELLIKIKLIQREEEIRNLIERDKIKEDALAHLSDQLLILMEKIGNLEKRK